MYSNTRFAEVLEALPRAVIERASREHNAGRYVKSFKPYDHLLALLYGQISGARSLRELEAGFNALPSRHYHLGTDELKRSTLSDANRRRTPEMFKDLVAHLMKRLNRQPRGELKEVLYLLDSTPIQLKGKGFEWVQPLSSSRHHGLKVHLMLDATEARPQWLQITPGNVNDITAAQQLPLESVVRYVFDKGYTDYRWWCRVHQSGSHFVTRFKRNAGIAVRETRELEAGSPEVIADEVVSFKHRHNRAKHTNPYYGLALRRITVERGEGDNPLVLATNDLASPAHEIAAQYRQRWGIELFFKWLKQHLKIKRFWGRNRNAVLLQLYAAILSYLLLWLYHGSRSGTVKDLYLTLMRFRTSLFEPVERGWQHHYRERRRAQAQLITERQYVIAF